MAREQRTDGKPGLTTKNGASYRTHCTLLYTDNIYSTVPTVLVHYLLNRTRTISTIQNPFPLFSTVPVPSILFSTVTLYTLPLPGPSILYRTRTIYTLQYP